VDAFGNKELLHRDPAISSLWPVPLQARARPSQVASTVTSSGGEEGVFMMQNVNYAWPPLPPGSIKQLRIVQVLPKTTWHANEPMVGLANASPGRQVLGTVPVEADGSAHFRAPAKVALAFQALDEQGEAVQMMRSVTYLQPGETAACIGCHEPRQSAPPVSRGSPLAFRRPASVIAPGPEGSNPLSYPLLVQPVLDRHCVRCHNPQKPDGKVVLTGEPQGRFTISYNALAPRVPFSAWGGKPGDFRQVNSEPMTQPDFFGARASSLMTLLRQGHEKVALSPAEFERLATWMDANALFYGTFDPAGQARQLRGERIAAAPLE
jgi:mono/diheme cytochrome c family protein